METIEMKDTFMWGHISKACEEAVKLADAEGKQVHFKFNDTDVTVQPGEQFEVVQARWHADFTAAQDAWLASPERAAEVAAQEEKERLERAAVMKETASTEKEMRDAVVPWPKTEKQLAEYIESLVDRQHDYVTCVYAMSMAAVAAFQYMCGKMGSTGFQAGCADLDILRRIRGIKGPFMLINGEDALYPQYNLPGRLDEALEKWKPWLKEQAEKKLQESPDAHPNVVEHWKELAEK